MTTEAVGPTVAVEVVNRTEEEEAGKDTKLPNHLRNRAGQKLNELRLFLAFAIDRREERLLQPNYLGRKRVNFPQAKSTDVYPRRILQQLTDS